MLASDHEQLGRVAGLVRDVLGADAAGAYLFGSAVLGGLQPRSDLDVLVVSNRRTTRDEKRRLTERLLAISGRDAPEGWWRYVELTIVVASEIKPWRYPPPFDFLYGDWMRSAFESGDADPWPAKTSPDLTVLIAMVLLGNAPLFGPPPDELLDPVPHDDLMRAVVADVDGLLGDLGDDTRNVILTLARIWSTLSTDVIRSKAAAADWALARLPGEHRAVLAHARAIYLGEAEESWGGLEHRVRPYADQVVKVIARLAQHPSEDGSRRELSD